MCVMLKLFYGIDRYHEERTFGADSYEPYFPYEGSPEYRRLYYGNYTVFYVIDGDDMDVRRILWSGADDIAEQ